MKFLQNKVVALGIAAFFAVSFSACGDDSSSGPSKQTGEDVIIDDEVPSDSVDTDDVKSSSSTKKETKVSSSSAKTEKTTSSSTKSEKTTSSSTKSEKVSSSSVKGKSSSSKNDDDDNSVDFDESKYDLGECDNPNEIITAGFSWTEIFKYVCVDDHWEIMSSSSAAVSSSSFDLELQFNPDIAYGKLVDDRDGKTYKTIVIKNHEETDSIVMFAENLNYGTQVMAADGQVNDGEVEKFCYNDDSWYCDHGFGGLYTWAEAMNVPSACNDELTGSSENCPKEVAVGAQGICPNGWHVMDYNDFYILISGYGGEDAFRVTGDLLSRMFFTYDGQYKDECGASIFLSGRYGYCKTDSLGYGCLGEIGNLWMRNEINEFSSGFVEFDEDEYFVRKATTWKTEAFSVRCVKDAE